MGYSPIDEDEWLNIVYQTIRGKRQPKVIEDFYAFGFEGNRLVELDDAAATVSLDELPAPEHMAETDALIPRKISMLQIRKQICPLTSTMKQWIRKISCQ